MGLLLALSTACNGDGGDPAPQDDTGATTAGDADVFSPSDADGTDATDGADVSEPDIDPVDPGELAWDSVRLGTRQTLRRIWGAGDGTFWAVGDRGTVLWYNGATWTPGEHVTDADLHGVAGIPGGAVWAVGAQGTVLRRDTAGWNVLDAGVEVDLYAVYPVSATEVYLVGDEGTILRFDGQEFKADISNTSAGLRTVFVPPGGVPVAGGTGGQVFKRTGGQWLASQAASPGETITSVWGTSAQFLVAVGTGGTILTSTGTNWTAQTSNDIKAHDLYGVWGVSDEEVYCAGDGGVIIVYDGSKWTVAPTEGPQFTTAGFRSIWGATAGDGRKAFAVGLDGAAQGFDGERWRDARTSPDLAMLGLSSLPDGSFVAAGEQGLLLRWTASRGWGAVRSGLDADLRAVAPLGDRALVVGDGGAMAEVDEVGRVIVRDSGSTRGLRGATALGDAVLVVGEAGAGLRVTAEPVGVGASTPESTGTVTTLNAVAAGSDGVAVAVGDSGAIVVRAAGGGWTTEVAPTANDLHAVAVTGAGTFAAGDHGVILRRNGTAWVKEAEAPAEFIFGLWGNDASVIGVGWAGRVVRRGDDGVWVEELSGTSNVLEAVDAAPGGPVWAVGHRGTVLRRR